MALPPKPQPISCPPVLVPAAGYFVHLSGWTGLMDNYVIDPLGVECFADPEDPDHRSGADGSTETFLHLLSSQCWSAEESRAWVMSELARLRVPNDQIEDDYANYELLLEAAEVVLRRSGWRDERVSVEGAALSSWLLELDKLTWGAVAEAEDVVVCMVAIGVDRSQLILRWASDEEQGELVADAVFR